MLMRNSGSQSAGAYLYCRTRAFSMFWRTYSSGVSLTCLPVRKSTTFPSGTASMAATGGAVNGAAAGAAERGAGGFLAIRGARGGGWWPMIPAGCRAATRAGK